jgi:hypothetical protein
LAGKEAKAKKGYRVQGTGYKLKKAEAEAKAKKGYRVQGTS